MKVLSIPLLLLWTGIVVAMQLRTEGDQIMGVWISTQRTSKIEFSKSGNHYSAKIVWLAEPNDASGNPKLDINNPDARKRQNPLVGTVVIEGLHYSENAWIGGRLYLPKRGMYVNCSAAIIHDTLKITGSKGLFSDTKTWLKR
ncbi:MAG: DUF2147 domain-containing protein [Breznakibacter sp.]